MTTRWIEGPIARAVPFYALGTLVALGLKCFYSRAGVEDLGWILRPITGLAHFLTGIRFEHELGAGWITHAHRMIVGTSCAGLNFMIIVFAALYFSFLIRVDLPAARGAWLAICLASAYLLTVVTNAIRIVVAIHLRDVELHGAFLGPEGVHRLEGVIVYALSLLLAYLGVEQLFDRLHQPSRRRLPSFLNPLGWYAAVALGVPLLRWSFERDASRYRVHAAVVLSVCAVLAGAAFAIGRIRRRFPSWHEKNETTLRGC
ncbi:MAG TPA: exosortase K [Candidatus Polarisedimenticolia bacterium]|nr:exosortase K [Candidatus Polarisedimenticolia bacterium]